MIGLGVAIFAGLSWLMPTETSGVGLGTAVQCLGALALVSSGLVYARRIRLGVAARNAAIWVAIGSAMLLGYSFRFEAVSAFERVRGELIPAYAISDTPHSLTINASDDGGFYVMGRVNGAPVRFVIDTGAGGVLLSPADAKRAGVDVGGLDYRLPSETANGVGYAAPYQISALEVGPIRMSGVPAAVDKTPMSSSLLGTAFLRRLDSFSVKGDRLTLTWH